MEKDKGSATITNSMAAQAQHVGWNIQVESEKSTDWPESHETETGTCRSSVLPAALGDCSGRERLERHRIAMAGQVWIPDRWGQECFLHDWKDCKGFDAPHVHSRIMSARAALMEVGRRKNSSTPPVEHSC